jgi:hypothetical protein
MFQVFLPSMIVATLLAASPLLAQAPSDTCSESASVYLEQFAKTQKPIAMVCYQYAVQREPGDVTASSEESPVDKSQKVLDVFGRRIRDNKMIVEETWQPLPGFDKIFYDTKTLSRFYTGGRVMLQIMGTSTLGDNPFKVAMTLNCYERTLTYTGVARRRTRVYDYDSQYNLPGKFSQEQIQQTCDALSDRPLQIQPSSAQ